MNFKYKNGFLILEFLILEKTVFCNIQNVCYNIRNYL